MPEKNGKLREIYSYNAVANILFSSLCLPEVDRGGAVEESLESYT